MCTDTPGEFVWQAGTLLQAVQEGRWILLEDIDLAPMDVVSVLIPLLESSALSVPAHGNVVKAAPGFQLFATQRYMIIIHIYTRRLGSCILRNGHCTPSSKGNYLHVAHENYRTEHLESCQG